MGREGVIAALRNHRLVFLDTPVFIYLLEDNPRYSDLSVAALGLVESGELIAVTSTLTLAELLVAPARANNIHALRDYSSFVRDFPHLRLAPIGVRIATRAAHVRAATRLKLPDAIQIATAQVAGADAILSNDAAWRGRTGRVDLLLLGDFAAPD